VTSDLGFPARLTRSERSEVKNGRSPASGERSKSSSLRADIRAELERVRGIFVAYRRRQIWRDIHRTSGGSISAEIHRSQETGSRGEERSARREPDFVGERPERSAPEVLPAAAESSRLRRGPGERP